MATTSVHSTMSSGENRQFEHHAPRSRSRSNSINSVSEHHPNPTHSRSRSNSTSQPDPNPVLSPVSAVESAAQFIHDKLDSLNHLVHSKGHESKPSPLHPPKPDYKPRRLSEKEPMFPENVTYDYGTPI
eukprot:CAMPEP_0184675688 /NCGR_PEP_ID=MMETSP0308-20130426/87929_1 /TAXON_ID=38269 /ORGANISM="Gloeochaete witrockiana, Strain SAG 46.84" /LENGTH=128 /DNA_ID=CAMNT_0027123421 /DNA_START=523 /DNA_END=909 /DNA_ORIENTATION=-